MHRRRSCLERGRTNLPFRFRHCIPGVSGQRFSTRGLHMPPLRVKHKERSGSHRDPLLPIRGS